MSERSAVQNPMLKYAHDIGWDYVKPDEALRLRGGDTGPFFTDVLEAQLLKLNHGILDPTLAAEVIRRLRLLPATIEGNRDALAWLRGEQSVFVPDQKRERNVRLLDFACIDANLFQVTDEWWVKGVTCRNRADVVFLINGIPVAVAETKAAHRPNGSSSGWMKIPSPCTPPSSRWPRT